MAMLCNVAWADIDADGAVVTFTNVQQDGKEYALYINDSGQLATSASSATDLGDAAKFRATRLESGKWTFYNEAKSLYMIWRGNDSGYNGNKGVLGEYNGTYCDWALVSGDGSKMGTHYMVSKRSNGTDDGSVVILNSGSFDKYGNSAGWASNYSNLYRIDIVELAPSTMEFFYNLGDGAYAGSGWCKNWTSNNASKPSLAVVVDVNNVNGGQAEAIGIRPGKNGSATFNVNAGCGMLSLSFEAKGTNNHKIEINGVEQTVGTEWKKFVINGVNASTASFVLKGDNNNDCLLRNIRIVTSVLYVKPEVEGSWENNPNTHFGRVRATVDGNVSVVNLTTAHLEEATYMFYSGGNDVVDFTRDYRGFEFQGYSLGGVDLGKSFTLTDEHKALITAENPLVAKFTATEEVTLFYDDDVKSYRIPAIGKTSTGRLIAVSDYRHNLDDIGMDRGGTGSHRIDLVIRTSDDNGKTWSPKQTIAEGTDVRGADDCAFGDAAIAVVGKKVLVMAAAGDVIFANGTADAHNRTWRVYSEDNGATWNKEDISTKLFIGADATIPNGYTAFFGSGKLAVDEDFNGTGVARIYGAMLIKNASGTYNNFVIYTDNFGADWKILGGSTSPIANQDEPKVEILPSGQILFSVRRGGGRQFNVFTYGTGENDKANGVGIWNGNVNGCDNEGSNSTNGEIYLVDAKRPDGTDVKLLFQSQPVGGGTWDRENVSIWYKEINGAADYVHTSSEIALGWTKGMQVSHQLSAYSTMVLQDDGRIAFFFEEAPCYNDNYVRGYCMVYTPLTIDQITKGHYFAPNADLNTERTINVVLTDAQGNDYRDQVQSTFAGIAEALAGKYSFITLGDNANLSMENGAYTYTNTVTLPFKVSGEEEIWHNIYFPSNTGAGYPIYFSAAAAGDTYVGKVTEQQTYGNSTYNTADYADKISWAVYNVDGGFTFKFKNKLTGKFIQATGVATGNAQNVKYVDEANATAFKLVPDAESYNGDYALKAVIGGTTGYLCSTSASYGNVTHYNGYAHQGAWVKFVEVTDFEALIAEVNATLDMIGTGLGQYTASEANVAAAAAAKEAMKNSATVKLNALNSYKTLTNGATLNMPVNGQYMRVAYDYGNAGKLYMQSTASSVKGLEFTAATDAASIWVYYDGSLYSCSANKNLREHGDDRGLSDTKTTAEFSASSRAKGKYNIKCGSFIHANSSNGNYYTDHCSNDGGHAAHDFILEEVEGQAFALTISGAGYATLYLGYPVAIPAGVEVYIATSIAKGEEGGVLKMAPVAKVLPANTGVIVRAQAATYHFIESDETPDDVTGSLLEGTTTDEDIPAASGYNYYVLANKNGVGMYRAAINDKGTFKNNANKAYLALSDDDQLGIFDKEIDTANQLSNRLRFDFSGSTDIEQTTVGGQQTTVIYDLLGRRVENPTKGVYIVGGKKVMIR